MERKKQNLIISLAIFVLIILLFTPLLACVGFRFFLGSGIDSFFEGSSLLFEISAIILACAIVLRNFWNPRRVMLVIFAVLVGVNLIFSGPKIGRAMKLMSANGKVELDPELIPLTSTELFGVEEHLIKVEEYEQTKSFLGTYENYSMEYSKNSLHYVIYRSDYPWLLDLKWKEYMNDLKSHNNSLGKPKKRKISKEWQVDKAYQIYFILDEGLEDNKGNRYAEKYLVRTKHCMMIFDENYEFTKEQIALIKEKLKLN